MEERELPLKEKKEKENEQVRVEFWKEEGCLLHCRAEATSPFIEQVYHRALKEVARAVSLPGFRRGRAPLSLLEKHYHSHIEAEWKRILQRELFQQGVELVSHPLLNNQSLSKIEWSQCIFRERALLSFSYIMHPEVPLLDESKLRLEKQEAEPVREEEIEEKIEKLFFSFEDWEREEDRPVEEGDYLQLSHEKEEKRSLFPFFQEEYFYVKKEKLPEKVLALFLGKKVGERVCLPLEQESTEESKEKEEETYEVTILSLHKKPSLEKLLEKEKCTSKEKLHEKIRENLAERNTEILQSECRSLLLDQLCTKYVFDVPKVRSEKEEVQKQEEKSEIQTLSSLLRERKVEERMRIYFLFDRFAKERQFSLTQEEIDREISFHLLFHKLAHGKQALSQEQFIQNYASHFLSIALREKIMNELIAKKLKE